MGLDYRNCADDAIREYGKEDIRYLPSACYMPRWNTVKNSFHLIIIIENNIFRALKMSKNYKLMLI